MVSWKADRLIKVKRTNRPRPTLYLYAQMAYILVTNFSQLEELALLYLSRPAIQARIVMYNWI